MAKDRFDIKEKEKPEGLKPEPRVKEDSDHT